MASPSVLTGVHLDTGACTIPCDIKVYAASLAVATNPVLVPNSSLPITMGRLLSTHAGEDFVRIMVLVLKEGPHLHFRYACITTFHVL